MQNTCQSSQKLLVVYCLFQVHVDILTSLHVWYSLDLLDKTTAAKQRTAKARRFASFHIDTINDDDAVEVVRSGFVNDEDDEGDDEQWEDEWTLSFELHKRTVFECSTTTATTTTMVVGW
jgi:hypothetical protein